MQDQAGKLVDIEDLCSKCEAIPEEQRVQVTDFPLKVKKQEVPRVTDVVCVVKFKTKSSSSSEDVRAKVLIRKRPAKGVVDLLCMLQSFCAEASLYRALSRALGLSGRPRRLTTTKFSSFGLRISGTKTNRVCYPFLFIANT